MRRVNSHRRKSSFITSQRWRFLGPSDAAANPFFYVYNSKSVAKGCAEWETGIGGFLSGKGVRQDISFWWTQPSLKVLSCTFFGILVSHFYQSMLSNYRIQLILSWYLNSHFVFSNFCQAIFSIIPYISTKSVIKRADISSDCAYSPLGSRARVFGCRAFGRFCNNIHLARFQPRGRLQSPKGGVHSRLLFMQ